MDFSDDPRGTIHETANPYIGLADGYDPNTAIDPFQEKAHEIIYVPPAQAHFTQHAEYEYPSSYNAPLTYAREDLHFRPAPPTAHSLSLPYDCNRDSNRFTTTYPYSPRTAELLPWKPDREREMIPAMPVLPNPVHYANANAHGPEWYYAGPAIPVDPNHTAFSNPRSPPAVPEGRRVIVPMARAPRGEI